MAGRRRRRRLAMGRRGAPGYEAEIFIRYYYFSYVLLQEAAPIFRAIMNGNDQHTDIISELLALIEPEGAGM